MKTHTLTVRDRRLSWDDRTLVRGSVAADRVEVALDDEYKACDTVHAIMVSAAHPEPVRMVVEGGSYSIPSELTRETGSILTCLIGYVGEVQRVTSEQESQPLVVAKSGPVCGTDPEQEQPDLWRQLMETVEESKRIAQSVRDDADAGRFDGEDGAPGAPGAPGKPGDKGDPGTPGRDGTSPIANVQQTAEGATVSITDVNGTTTATIRNGAKGDPGDKGNPGKDGTSPTASVKRTDTGAVITVTDANGTTSAEVLDGRDGETVIPDLGVTNVKIADNAVNTRTIADGAVTRAKLAQDALMKAGAGISIADDGTAAVDMDGLRDMMRVSNQRIGVPVDGVSTGGVYYHLTPLMLVIVGQANITVRKPADATGDYVRFMRLYTGMTTKKAVTHTDAALIKESTGVPRYVGYSIDTDGTVWLEMYLTDNDEHTFAMDAFSNIVIPLCGGWGRVLENLWRWGSGTAIEGLHFDLLDDGGLSVYYDAVRPNLKWCNIMWRGTLEDVGMRVGETYYLAEFGTARSINTNVRFLDADSVIIPNQPSAFEHAITAPEGAAYVEMYVSLSGEQKPQRFVSYPMFVRGAKRPGGFVMPTRGDDAV